MSIKLNLASGMDYIDGYINIDNKSMFDCKVDLVADIIKLNYEKEIVDEILLSHFAMYLVPEEMLVLLKKWYNWLKKDGRIIIETGDVKKIAKIILDNDDAKIINGKSGITYSEKEIHLDIGGCGVKKL